MSGPFGSSQWMYSSGGFYDFPIEQSLKFNDDDSSYLSWTPASAGNRKTWTWSGWVKRGNLGGTQTIFGTGSGAGGSVHTALTFNTSNQLDTGVGVIGVGTIFSQQTNAVFRDTSAWYHIVLVYDTSNATSTDRVRIYVNGERQSVSGSFPSQNYDCGVNTTQQHRIGSFEYAPSNLLDGYLAEVNFIDGQALDPTSFGEFKSGVWIPKDPSGLTYGTNGFRLSFQNDTVSEGFNTVTYTGNNAQRSITGVGFQPDLVWTKYRSAVGAHTLMDSVRGASARLFSNLTNAEAATNGLISFDADGFTMGDNATSHNMNASGETVVAWCWDAGSGSPVSNTSGSITSTVKANAAYGMSIISYTGNGSTGATVGHGLSSAPEMIIVKNRDISDNWAVYHSGIGATHGLNLNATTAAFDWDRYWNDTAPTSSVFTVGGPIVDAQVNGNGNDIIAYAFHSVTGYSKVGSYTGNGSTSGPKITTGFRPAFLMVKKTDSAENWFMIDNTRYTSTDEDGGNIPRLLPNTSDAESTDASIAGDFLDDGFQIKATQNMINTNGGNYIYIAFADTRDNAFWRDQSGNGNDWQPNNLTYQDSLPDSTTNNFAVLNPNLVGGLFGGGAAYGASEGNLKGSNTGSGGWASMGATFSMSSGKWYWEFASGSAAGESAIIGIHRATGTLPVGILGYTGDTDGYAYGEGGSKFNNSTGAAYGATWDQNDVIGIAYDADAGNLTFYKNNVSQGVAFSGLSGEFIPAISTTSGIGNGVLNFGQDSSFAGNKPAQGNTDDNGVGDFYYAPPSGFLALCSENLPSPAIDPAKDDTPSDYFNSVLYTGTGSSQAITGLTFQPDLVWAKGRSDAFDHNLYDAVRGAYKRLQSNTTSAEVTYSGVTSFNSDGFTVEQNQVNNSGTTYVGWSWLAGNGTSSNTDGSITSTVSVNQKAGFSVVSYVGNGSTNQTVGHGLGVKPSIVIYKDRDAATAWRVIPTFINDGHYLALNNTDAIYTGSTAFFGTNTSSVLGISGSSSGIINASGNDIIAYCFAEVEGFSKFGTYYGNSSSDGTFIYLGFRPAWFMLKRVDSTGEWWIYNAKTEPYNVMDTFLQANSSSAEIGPDATSYGIDFVSNGFKHRSGLAAKNLTGGTYIYMAFAEMPFKYSNAR